MTSKVTTGTVHGMPSDLMKALKSDKSGLERWEDLTPLAKNEWICWNVSVKQEATRKNHIKRTIAELKEGKRRPCCWAGCLHRTDRPLSPTKKWLLSKQTESK
jgi:hypothetical protein